MAEEIDDISAEPQKKKFKSGKSTMHSFVTFFNHTSRLVDVVWLNYEGAGVRYVTLKPREFVDVNTFVGHPWIFRDSQTGEKMVAQLREVYEPEELQLQGNPSTSRPRRKPVNITIPVYSLKERCLREVRKLVPRSDLPRLEIPETLIKKLQEMDHTVWNLQDAANGHSDNQNAANNDA